MLHVEFCPCWHPQDSALPFVLPCTLSWPVAYDVDFLARRVRGVPSSCFLHLPLRLVATDAASRKLSLSKSPPGKWTAPLTHPGPKLIVCWTPGPTGRFGGVLRKDRRGTPPDPRGAYNDRYDRSHSSLQPVSSNPRGSGNFLN